MAESPSEENHEPTGSRTAGPRNHATQREGDHALADTEPLTRALPSSRALPTIEQASQMAGTVLDEMVATLIKVQRPLPQSFFDWMAGEASDMVVMELERGYRSPRFLATLELDNDPMQVIRRWVLHWVCPHLVSRYSVMAELFPAYRQSEPAALMSQPMPLATDGPDAIRRVNA